MGKIYFIADAHLSGLLYANRPRIAGDTYRALRSVVAYIKKDEADEKCVVFCGDNLDSKSPGPKDIKEFISATDELWKAGIRVLGVEGNHDKVLSRSFSNTQWIKLAPSVEHIDGKEVTVMGLKIRGLDYVQGKKIYDSLSELPDCDILVMHQPLAHLSPFEANTVELEGIPDQVVKAVVSGHVHIPDKRKTSSGTHVVSPGALHAQKLTHSAGSFAVYDTETDSFDFINTPVHRLMKRFVCNNAGDMDEAEDFLRLLKEDADDSEKPVIGIKYSSDLGARLVEIRDRYADRIHFFPSIIPDDKEETEIEEDSGADSETIMRTLFKQLGMDCGKEHKIVFEKALEVVDGGREALFGYLRELEEERNEIEKTGS